MKAKAGVHKYCTLVDKLVSYKGKVNNPETAIVYTRIE